jgi:SAM-dependent methyltransferase
MNRNEETKPSIDLRELGLAFAHILGKYFFQTEDLHYGLWTDDLEVESANIRKAQEKHSELLISHIPGTVKTVLDVGCGVGALARRLIERGHEVECLTPSVIMARIARENLGEKTPIHITRFEDFESAKRFDLVLFSESFQYVELERSINHARDLLNDGGRLLICDFFKTEQKGHSPMSGGPRFSKFQRVIQDSGLQLITDLDITRETAPNLTIIADLLNKVGVPLRDLIAYAGKTGYPKSSRFIAWAFQKRLAKLDRKYFLNLRNAESFALFKTYRLLLLQKPAP